MKLSTRVWVELVPIYWHDWEHVPNEMKVGKVLKKAPTQAERHRYVEIVIDAEKRHFAPFHGVTL